MTAAGVASLSATAGRPSDLKEPKLSKNDDDTEITRMRDRYHQAAEAWSSNADSYVTDTAFSSTADQWPDDVKQLRGTGRPTLTINRLNGVIKQIIGDYRQNKISIKVLPASGDASEDTADILAGLLRNIEMESDADMVYVNALECAARGGFGYFRIVPEYASDDVFDQNLFIRPIHNPLTVLFDPSARLITRADAKYCFVTEMIGRDEFKRLYPDAATEGFDKVSQNDDNIEDWSSENDVRIAEYFVKETVQVRLVAFNTGAVLEIDDDSEQEALAQIGWTVASERQADRTQIRWRKVTGREILDERVYKMRYIPVIPVFGEEVNLKGKVHTRSAIYYAKDAQRMMNYWKTAATESVALAAKAPWLVTPEHIENLIDQWGLVNSMPQPYLLYNHNPNQPPPQQIQPPSQPIGEMSMAAQSGNDIQYTTNVFDAMLGQRSNESSGVAISERQSQGATSNYLFVDNLKKAIEHCGRVLIDMVPLVYDAERVVRVIGLEGDTSTETINQEIKNPLLGITTVLNDITVGKYDVIVETGPAFASRRREAVDGMIKLIQAIPQLGMLIADIVVKNMDYPGHAEIAARIKRSLPPQLTTDPDSPEGQQIAAQQQQQQQQAQQTQQQLVQAHLQTEQGKLQAEHAKAGAQVAKAQAEIVKAKADTIQALADTHKTGVEAMEQRHEVQPMAIPSEPFPARASHPPQTDNAMNSLAQHVQGMAGEHAQNTENIAQMLHAIGESLARQHQMNAEQTAQMHELLQHVAGGHHAIANALQHSGQASSQSSQIADILHNVGSSLAAGHHALATALDRQNHALEHQNKIAAAPVHAVRDKTGRITHKQVVLDS